MGSHAEWWQKRLPGFRVPLRSQWSAESRSIRGHDFDGGDGFIGESFLEPLVLLPSPNLTFNRGIGASSPTKYV